MSDDRITEIRIGGMRCIEQLRLKIGGLTVLVGDNGAGKSTIIEALELLRKAAHPGFVNALYSQHFGLSSLLRQGSERLELKVRAEGSGGEIEYGFSLGHVGNGVAILGEAFAHDGRGILLRSAVRAAVHLEGTARDVPIAPNELMIGAFGLFPPEPHLARMLDLLRGIDVHLPFDTTPRWAARQLQRTSPLRESGLVESTSALSFFGVNLASAWHALRQDFGPQHWEETLAWVRLGLGYDIETIDTTARLADQPGRVALAIRDRRFSNPIPAHSLSDGMLAYLAMVALCRLNTRKSLIAFDEPELHFHPALLGRVVQLFEECSKSTPVILATHSDRLLDGLSDPVSSVVRSALDDRGVARFFRADPAEFERWLAHYAGLGAMRAAGMEPVVLSQAAGA